MSCVYLWYSCDDNKGETISHVLVSAL
jgi:hypothetical protein